MPIVARVLLLRVDDDDNVDVDSLERVVRDDLAGVVAADSFSALSSRDNDLRPPWSPVVVVVLALAFLLSAAGWEEEGRELTSSERGLVETSGSSLPPAAGLAAAAAAAADRGEVSSDEDISLHCTVLSSSFSPSVFFLFSLAARPVLLTHTDESTTTGAVRSGAKPGTGPPRLTSVESLRRPVGGLKLLLPG